MKTRRTETATHARREPVELTTVDLLLSLAEPLPEPVTRLASRGGRSAHECGLLSTPGREIEELLPAAQRFKDAQDREALRASDLQARVAALRPGTTELDPRKLFIAAFKRKFPKVKGRALCLALDNAEIEPVPSWTARGGTRLWLELWDHPASRGAVRRWIYGCTQGT